MLGIILAMNMFVARLPALYFNYSQMESHDSGSFLTYDTATLLVTFSVVPIGLFSQFWSVSFMLFQKEFTACPGKYVRRIYRLRLCFAGYLCIVLRVQRLHILTLVVVFANCCLLAGCCSYNSIHDPIIYMVSVATMTEGAMDVLSCSTLMQLATNDLPDAVNVVVVLFCLFELLNACLSFAIQSVLSGGHEDTPSDLIQWTAALRGIRAAVDFGTFVLRVVLWVKYKAVSSVFLIKNLYNLIHAWVEIERSVGVKKYPKNVTLFTEFVNPADWYGMDKEQWRIATSDTLLAQAQSGRRV